MSVRTVLLAAIALAPAAFAQGKPDALPPVASAPSAPATVAVQGLRFDGSCDAGQQAIIGTSIATARTWLGNGLTHLRNEPGSAHAARWYGAGQAKGAYEVLRRTLERLETPASFTISCSASRCEGGTFAWAIPQRSLMNLCQTFFRAADRGVDSRPGVIVHEMSHIAAGTGDRDREGRFVYGPANVQRLAVKGDGAAVNVADAHEYFLETMEGH